MNRTINSCYNNPELSYQTKNSTFHFELRKLTITSCYEVMCTSSFSLIFVAVLVSGGYLLYKLYVDPFNYVRELTDIGYDHIRGPNRAIKIARAMTTRRYGSKLPPPYPNGWYALVDSRELKVGAVKSVDVLGENLCVYRGKDGIACCVNAYCPHLGANLAIGGQVKGNCIECPFHKWTFDNQGSCIFVPGQESPPKGITIKTWVTCEAEGAVWIWYDADGSPPRWKIEDLEQYKGWGYRGKNDFVVNSHIQDIPENGADVAHLNAVHSPPMVLGDLLPYLAEYLGGHYWSAEWTKGEDHTATIKLSHEYRIGKYTTFNVNADILQIGPSHVRLLLNTPGGPILISQTITPLSPLQQRVIHRVFSPTYNAVIAAMFIWIEANMFERDVLIWNNKRFVHNPALSRMDKGIKAFRTWYSQFYSEKSLSFHDALRKYNDPLEW